MKKFWFKCNEEGLSLFDALIGGITTSIAFALLIILKHFGG